MNSAALRSRYVTNDVTTASPTRLLCMLYDRLLLDLDRAAEALPSGPVTAIPHLRHATDIIMSLRASLDLDAWSGSAALASLYDYLLRELLLVQTEVNADRLATCRELIAPLRDAWHEAEAELRSGASQGTPIPTPRPASA